MGGLVLLFTLIFLIGFFLIIKLVSNGNADGEDESQASTSDAENHSVHPTNDPFGYNYQALPFSAKMSPAARYDYLNRHRIR